MARPDTHSPAWSIVSAHSAQLTPASRSDDEDASAVVPVERHITATEQPSMTPEPNTSEVSHGRYHDMVVSEASRAQSHVDHVLADDEDDVNDNAFLLEDFVTVGRDAPNITPTDERRVRRKLDTHLVLFVALLYLISFLDRSNIGNARLAGLTTDLNLSDGQYQWLLTAFYLTYIAFEPLTLCYAVLPAHVHLAATVAAWGILASLQSLAGSFVSLLVLRALLGVAEAAFVGVPIYLSFFYRREELALRTGLFISAAPLATSFASTLAYLLVGWTENSSVAAWRWLFLVEGFPACLVAIWAFDWLPDSPSTARWLSAQEKKVATERLRADADGSRDRTASRDAEDDEAEADISRHRTSKSIMTEKPRSGQHHFSWRPVLDTLRDPKAYLSAFIFLLLNIAFSSMPVFLPTIVAGLDEQQITPRMAQALSAPPFLFAFLAVLITAYFSDRFRCRSIPLMFHGFMAAAGYAVLALAASSAYVSPTMRYLAVFPICAGFFSAVTLLITWTINNQKEREGKGAGVTILQIIGQLGPLIGTRLYPDSDGPFYTRGMSVCGFAMVGVVVLTWILRRTLIKENALMISKKRTTRSVGMVGVDDPHAFTYLL